MAQHWSGSDFELFCTDETFTKLGKESAVSILNHHYDIDWLLGWTLCQRIGLLGGSRVFNKNSTKFLPIVGWSFWFNEMLFLNREWESDKKSLVKGLEAILETPSDLPFNISILCEGTRFNKVKHEASMEIAKAKGLPLLKHHLLPRTKGFHLLIDSVKEKADFFCYDITIGMKSVNGEKPTLKHIKDGIPIEFQVYLRRIAVASIPVHDEKLCADWLQKLYREKDEIFDVYVKTGSFAEDNEIKRHYLKKNKFDLMVACTWIVLIALPSAFYLLAFLINGAWIAKLSLIGFFGIVNFAVKYLIASTDTNKASTYGSTPTKKKE